MARERLRPDHPWLSEYSNLLSERFITDNMEHHKRFVELVEELAHTARRAALRACWRPAPGRSHSPWHSRAATST